MLGSTMTPAERQRRRRTKLAVEAQRTKGVVRVGGGRGFLVEVERHRLIITAGHCLPHLPPSHAASHIEERLYANLVGPLRAEPTVWAECVFVDPVADIAVLASPDNQALWEEAEAYERLVEERALPLPIGSLSYTYKRHVLPDGTSFSGPAHAEDDAWLFSLDGKWFRCHVESMGRSFWITAAEQPIRGGMSGSPILSADGEAIGVVCVSGGLSGTDSHREGGPNPELTAHLPGWLLRDCRVPTFQQQET